MNLQNKNLNRYLESPHVIKNSGNVHQTLFGTNQNIGQRTAHPVNTPRDVRKEEFEEVDIDSLNLGLKLSW